MRRPYIQAQPYKQPGNAGRLEAWSKDPVALFVAAITIYVAILFLAYLANSGLLKALSYAAAFFIFMIMGAVSAFLPQQRISLGFGIALSLYYYGFIGSCIFNYQALHFATTIKMAMAPLFIAFGVAFESQNRFQSWNRQSVRWLFALLIILPFTLWLLQLASGQISYGSIGGVSIFANRNNAGLYAVTLIALYNVLHEKPVKNVLVYLAAGIGFGTLGVLLAVAASLILAVGGGRSIRFLLVSVVAGFGVVYFAPLDIGIFARIKPVVDSIILLLEGRIDIATVTYGDLVRLLNTTDLSFMFRLKHWYNLLAIYLNSSYEHWMLGFGVGSSMRLSSVGLVPHNDYIRVLFECGIVTFVGFVAIILLMLRHCGRRWEAIPLIAVAIYFFTENLIDNFVAMSVFFFCCGALSRRISITGDKANAQRNS